MASRNQRQFWLVHQLDDIWDVMEVCLSDVINAVLGLLRQVASDVGILSRKILMNKQEDHD